MIGRRQLRWDVTIQSGLRIEWIDVARGGSIVLVVLFHVSIGLTNNWVDLSLYWPVNDFFAPIRMPLFFMISGMLAKNVLALEWPMLLRKRVYPLTYLFILWSFIHLGYRALTEGLDGLSAESLYVFLYNPSSVLWFLWALVIYYIVAKTLKNMKTVAYLSAIVLSVLSYGDLIVFENYVHDNIIRYLPFFLFGAWNYNFIMRISKFKSGVLLAASFLIFCVQFFFDRHYGVPYSLQGPAKLMIIVTGLVLGISASVVLAKLPLLKEIFSYLGKNTLTIYVSHSPIVGSLSLLLVILVGQAWLIEYWAVPVITVLGITLSLGIGYAARWSGATWLYELPFGRAVQRAAG